MLSCPFLSILATESSWIMNDSLPRRITIPKSPCPIPAERSIEHNLMIHKMLRKITTPCETCLRGTLPHQIAQLANTSLYPLWPRTYPSRWIRITSAKIRGNWWARKLPNLYTGRRPLHGIYAALTIVEGCPEGRGRGRFNAAAGVRSLAGRVDEAVSCYDFTWRSRAIDSAAFGGVEGHCIHGICVDTFFNH